jgi:hypothetical protein
MASNVQSVLIIILVGVLSTQAGLSQKFFPDDPIQVMPPPLPVTQARERDVADASDFLRNSFNAKPGPPVRAGAINTIGEVPDSAWFTNRHGKRRMSLEELQRGAGTNKAPVPPFKIVSGKTAGVQGGFQMVDSAGRLYFVKLDPLSNPEMASGADVIVSKFFYAFGYNTPQNYIINANLPQFRLSHKARIEKGDWRERKMTWGDVEALLNKTYRYPDGSFRLMASLAIEGEPIGPFLFEGTRSDDPNDIVPHENRRDLRGLFIFAAWLNHTDFKASNTLDTIVNGNNSKGVPFIRHHLIDFGSSLGSDGLGPKDPRLGHEHMIPKGSDILKRIVTLGLLPEPWERADFPDLPAVGNFDSVTFEPDEWTTNYPNPAFLRRLADDEFWAAKIVMSFSKEDIRAIVETGCFSDPWTVGYITARLVERRNKIGQVFFSKVLPLDRFRVENGELQFDDLAAVYGFRPASQYTFHWYLFDNITQQRHRVTAGDTGRLPDESIQAPAGTYYSALIFLPNGPQKCVTVTVRKTANGYEVVGVERAW